MPNDIIPFGAGSGVPAHLQDLFGEDSNITARSTINQLSYRGKVWRRIVDGEETILTKIDADSGEQLPVPIVNVIVLDHNKGRSRAFYKDAYEEGKNAAPDCYSGDGVTPDSDVPEPCAATCALCPNSVKGSKINDNGTAVTACSPFKRIAIVPAGKAVASHAPMLLRLAQTSVWDKDNADNEAKGWYAWDQYMDFLRARGAKHTAAVVTRIKFDQAKAYPKLLFSAAGWASADEAAAAKKRLAEDADDIAKILVGGGKDGVAGSPKAAPAQSDDGGDDTAAQAAVKAALAKAEAEAKAKAAAAAKKAKAEAEAKAKAEAEAAAAAAASDDGGWGGEEEAAPAPAPKAEAKPKSSTKKAETKPAAEAVESTVETPSALADLLDGWDD